MKEIVPLTNWLHYFDTICGTFPDGKKKRVSSLVARDGLIVTTRTGSRYELVSPIPNEADLKLIDCKIAENTHREIE